MEGWKTLHNKSHPNQNEAKCVSGFGGGGGQGGGCRRSEGRRTLLKGTTVCHLHNVSSHISGYNMNCEL